MFYKTHLKIYNGHQVTERTEQQRLTAANAGKEVHSTGFVQTKSTMWTHILQYFIDRDRNAISIMDTIFKF